MDLVTSFHMVLQFLSPVMTAPSFESWLTLVTGWMFARRRTVTQMIGGRRGHRIQALFVVSSLFLASGLVA